MRRTITADQIRNAFREPPPPSVPMQLHLIVLDQERMVGVFTIRELIEYPHHPELAIRSRYTMREDYSFKIVTEGKDAYDYFALMNIKQRVHDLVVTAYNPGQTFTSRMRLTEARCITGFLPPLYDRTKQKWSYDEPFEVEFRYRDKIFPKPLEDPVTIARRISQKFCREIATFQPRPDEAALLTTLIEDAIKAERNLK